MDDEGTLQYGDLSWAKSVMKVYVDEIRDKWSTGNIGDMPKSTASLIHDIEQSITRFNALPRLVKKINII